MNNFSIVYCFQSIVIDANQITVERSSRSKSANVIKSANALIYVKELNEVVVSLGEKGKLVPFVLLLQYITLDVDYTQCFFIH